MAVYATRDPRRKRRGQPRNRGLSSTPRNARKLERGVLRASSLLARKAQAGRPREKGNKVSSEEGYSSPNELNPITNSAECRDRAGRCCRTLPTRPHLMRRKKHELHPSTADPATRGKTKKAPPKA